MFTSLSLYPTTCRGDENGIRYAIVALHCDNDALLSMIMIYLSTSQKTWDTYQISIQTEIVGDEIVKKREWG